MDAISSVGAAGSDLVDAWRRRQPGAEDVDETSDFVGMVRNGIERVSDAEHGADHLAERFAVGDPNVQLHDVTIAAAESSLSVQLMVAVRDRAVEAYQQVINLQV